MPWLHAQAITQTNGPFRVFAGPTVWTGKELSCNPFSVELQSVLSRFDGTQIERREGGVFITIECDSLFESDCGSMKPATCAEIAKMAEVVKKYPDTNIKVDVHTDCVHSEEKNLALSELQAWTIKKSLVDKGISPSRIKARGWGESKPAASNATEEGRKANRRVTIILAPQNS
ncbi:hypothetical protein SBDP1_610059 [Syntrophobacter sp. SbD1]|nr:hypothetical protein SBDP1_610059 [Syntrophobacter sp. SbD1]